MEKSEANYERAFFKTAEQLSQLSPEGELFKSYKGEDEIYMERINEYWKKHNWDMYIEALEMLKQFWLLKAGLK